MKKKNLLKSMLLLCTLMMGAGSVWADTKTKWIKTAPEDLVSGDVVVIVDSTKSVAMANNPAEDKVPSATSVTLNDGKDQISVKEDAELEANLQWIVTVTTSDGNRNYQFGVAETTNYLYATDADDGLRVGTGTPNSFAISVGGTNNSNFLCTKTGENNRYIGVYSFLSIINSWESKTSIDDDIKNSATIFFKKVESSKTDVKLSFPKENYEADYSSGANSFEAPTATCDPSGLTVTYSTSNKYVAVVNETTGAITLKKRGSAVITATYAGDEIYESATASYTLRVDQSDGDGGSANPFTVADAITYTEGGNTSSGSYYFVKGIISQIGSNSGSGYQGIDVSSIIPGAKSTAGTMTYYISDDGTTTNQLKISTGRGPAFSDLTADMISVGDEVIVVGPLTNSSETPSYTIGGTGGGDSEAKTTRMDADNYMHKLTRRILAEDKAIYLGKHKLMTDLCTLNTECETYSTYTPTTTTVKLSNDQVLSYNSEEGEVTASKEGVDTVTVSVKFTKDAVEMFTTERSFVITAKSRDLAPAGEGAGKYQLVTSASTALAEGDKLLIVATESGKNYALSSTAAMMGGMSGVEVTITDDVISEVPEKATVITLKSTADSKWNLSTGDNAYLYASAQAQSSGSEGGIDISSLLSMLTETDPNSLRNGTITETPGDSAVFTIAIDAEGLATITCRNDSIVRYGASSAMSKTSSSSSSSIGSMSAFNLFVNGATDGSAAKIYRFTESLNNYDITTSASGYKTIVSSYDVKLPDGLKAYVVSSKDASTTTLTDVTEKGIKEGHPYILKGEANTTYTLTGASATAPETNYLKVSNESTDSKTSTFYVLATKSGTTGFYKWTGGRLGKNRVYLSAESASAPMLAILFGETTGIAEVNCETVTDNRFYNLSGQRVAQPNKGLYIVGGKKVILK